jgi:hypothetical protein
MSWIDGDDPGALAIEELFFLRVKVDLSDDKEEVDEFSSQSCDSNPGDHFKFPPFLFLDIQLIVRIQYQNTFTTTNKQSSRKSRWMLPCMMRRRSSCII